MAQSQVRMLETIIALPTIVGILIGELFKDVIKQI